MINPISAATQLKLNDFANQAALMHRVEMTFHPQSWQAYAYTGTRLTWCEIDFPPEKTVRAAIPKASGVYVFLVKSDIFDFPYVSGIFYVGKAKNLYGRISSYISEINHHNSLRPLVWKMINNWHGHLKYLYTVTTDVKAAEALEDLMINAIHPYFNSDYSGDLSQPKRAFP